MKILKTHQLASGEILCLVNAREVPEGVRRGSYFGLNHSQVGEFAKWRVNPFDIGPTKDKPHAFDMLACQVLLEDVVGMKVHQVRVGGEFAIISPENSPLGVQRSSLKSKAILGSEYDSSLARYWAEKCSGPEKDLWPPCYVIVKTQDLVDARLGKPATGGLLAGLRPTSSTYDGKTAQECFDIYVAWMRGESRDQKLKGINKVPLSDLLTVHQINAAKDEWSRRVKAKTKASEEERKAKDRNQVLVDIDPDDYL